MTLYFAYGSNISKEQMQRRCPNAVAVGVYVLGDSKLIFRGVADCAYAKGSECHGVVWKITQECERALDQFEGVERGTYRKEYAPLNEPYEGEIELLFYVMNSDGIYPPTQAYLDRIIQGYKDFELPMESLRKAVRYAHNHSRPSWRERERSRREGHPKLGLSSTCTTKQAEPPKLLAPPKPHADGVAPKKKDKQQPDFFDWDQYGVVYGD